MSTRYSVRIGRGINVWSNVHVADVADLYGFALHKAVPGSLFYAESGAASMREAALTIGRLRRRNQPARRSSPLRGTA